MAGVFGCGLGDFILFGVGDDDVRDFAGCVPPRVGPPGCVRPGVGFGRAASHVARCGWTVGWLNRCPVVHRVWTPSLEHASRKLPTLEGRRNSALDEPDSPLWGASPYHDGLIETRNIVCGFRTMSFFICERYADSGSSGESDPDGDAILDLDVFHGTPDQ